MAPRKTGQPAAEKFDMKPQGGVHAAFGGQAFDLRRPTIGELRRFEERLVDMVAEQRENAASDDPDPHVDERLILGWWRDVFETLAGGDFPDDDECAPWLVSAGLITEVKTHWRSVPWGPGGSPTHRAAKDLEPLLKTAQSLLGGSNASTAQ